MPRRNSELEVDVNPNTAWMNGFMIWPFYIIMVGVLRGLLELAVAGEFIDSFQAWTATAVLHAVFQIAAFHWATGSPFWDDQGEHCDQTTWEQIDNGYPWSTPRKMLIIIPSILFLVVSHYTKYDSTHLLINAPVVLVLVLLKLPCMQRRNRDAGDRIHFD